MAVKFISVQCPKCTASLSFEEDRERAFCSYCGTQILLVNENERTYRRVDEADVRRAETERLIYLKELELEEKENERSRKGRRTAFIVAGVLAAVGALTEIVVPNNLIGVFMIVAAGWIALFAFTSKENQKKRRRGSPSSSDEVTINESLAYCEGENINGVVAQFRSAGFSNIQAVPLNDLGILAARKDGQVESVSINGDEDFDEGDVFSKSDNVVITYHSKR